MRARRKQTLHSGPGLLALAAGGILPLAFAPFELFWIAPFAVGVQYWVWLQASTGRDAFRLGWLFGVGLFGVGTSWVQVSVAQFGGVDLTLSWVVAVLFVSGMALFPALQGAILFWLGQRFARSVLLLFPLFWVVFEWLRSWLLGGFPWLLLGHTAPGTFYRGLAPWVGTLGVSLFLAWIALLLLRTVVIPRQRGGVVVQLLLLSLLAWGSSQQQWGEPQGEPVSVALVQGNIAQDQKWLSENLFPTLRQYRIATEESRAQLVIWPETAIPAFRQRVESIFLQPFSQRLAAEGRTLLTGMPLLEWNGEKRHYYNAIVAVGAESGSYRKRHLVPMGEYLPFEGVLRPLLNFIQIPFSSFSAGAEQQSPLSVGEWVIGPTVCYEIAYPRLTFSYLPQASLLVTVSNDGWFGNSLAPDQHLQIARMRALESARPLLRATNTGITALIDADGEIIEQLYRSEQGVLEGEIQPRQGVTPYLYWSSMFF